MLRSPRSAVAFAALLSLAACGGGDKAASDAAVTAIPDVQIPALSLKTLQDVTKELSSDAYEGRAPGTEGEDRTIAYVVGEWAKAGLQAVPDSATPWLQPVHIDGPERLIGQIVPVRIDSATRGSLSGSLVLETV